MPHRFLLTPSLAALDNIEKDVNALHIKMRFRSEKELEETQQRIEDCRFSTRSMEHIPVGNDTPYNTYPILIVNFYATVDAYIRVYGRDIDLVLTEEVSVRDAHLHLHLLLVTIEKALRALRESLNLSLHSED